MDTKLFSVKDAVTGIISWASSENGAKTLKATGFIMQAGGMLLTASGGIITKKADITLKNIAHDRQLEEQAEAFCGATDLYLKNHTRLINEAMIEKAVEKEFDKRLSDMDFQDLLIKAEEARRRGKGE